MRVNYFTFKCWKERKKNETQSLQSLREEEMNEILTDPISSSSFSEGKTIDEWNSKHYRENLFYLA